MNKLNVALIEKTPILEEGLKSILNSPPINAFLRSVGTYNGLTVDIRQKPLDLLIVNIDTEAANSLICSLSLLKKQNPALRIITYFESISPKNLKRLLASKFEGILLKQDAVSDFAQVIAEVIMGKRSLSNSAKELILDYSLGLEPKKQRLTIREQEVLQLIIEEHTTKEIAKKLFISSCTVETHRLNIIQKLGVRNTAGIVREAMRMDLY